MPFPNSITRESGSDYAAQSFSASTLRELTLAKDDNNRHKDQYISNQDRREQQKVTKTLS